ncbi:hypothetical protein SEA_STARPLATINUM_284 [Streptomyces phage StarPlatinum]|uniref:Uncharacterized protein n=1 Tax=Streptomyces phage StarPlatinum TaxID=2283265 RepID=A0A345M8E2_9CAUD|nr:hypothetical protein HWB77_gp014 [Streptomyces phage StarPlatinum]YP_009839677.1 hypothetical protein HWB77_gp049 [Streptomyces phage StarPlatinum]AXH66763.1 hypothetical protein SEA_STARPLATINUM_14 [Streptomyces phage StarPlatinum]AXH66987.1 hypothetical protein SEA_STARPLATINUM_284 [Streptomyces phage StarPlatinum]
MREDLRRLRNERYMAQNKRVKEIKKLGEIKRQRAERYRNHRDIFDYDPLEWV